MGRLSKGSCVGVGMESELIRSEMWMGRVSNGSCVGVGGESELGVRCGWAG